MLGLGQVAHREVATERVGDEEKRGGLADQLAHVVDHEAQVIRVEGARHHWARQGVVGVKYKDGDVWDHDLQIDASNITFTMRPA